MKVCLYKCPFIFLCISFHIGNHEEPPEKMQVEINQDVEKGSHLKSTTRPSAAQRHNNNTKTNSEKDTDTDCLSNNKVKHSSVGSVRSIRSTASASQLSPRNLRRSAASSCEGAVPASPAGLVLSRSCLSSCSTVMVMEEKLMLNPVKSEVGGKSTHRIYFNFSCVSLACL